MIPEYPSPEFLASVVETSNCNPSPTVRKMSSELVAAKNDPLETIRILGRLSAGVVINDEGSTDALTRAASFADRKMQISIRDPFMQATIVGHAMRMLLESDKKKQGLKDNAGERIIIDTVLPVLFVGRTISDEALDKIITAFSYGPYSLPVHFLRGNLGLQNTWYSNGQEITKELERYWYLRKLLTDPE